jgi:hypothetical protein
LTHYNNKVRYCLDTYPELGSSGGGDFGSVLDGGNGRGKPKVPADKLAPTDFDGGNGNGGHNDGGTGLGAGGGNTVGGDPTGGSGGSGGTNATGGLGRFSSANGGGGGTGTIN